MFQLSRNLIAFALCFLFISPQAYACSMGSMEFTIFFNASDKDTITHYFPQLINADGMIEPPPDTDVIAEVVLTDINEMPPPKNLVTATASIARVIKTSDARIRQGKNVVIKFGVTSCGPYHSNGDKGTIVAKIGTDTAGQLVLCPYWRRVYDGQIGSRPGSGCLP
jgi:hypothetical protein